MSINVYFKGEEVKEIEGFETIKRTEQGEKRERYRLPGRIDLFHSNGRWYIILHYPIEPIPSLVSDIVEEISFREWIPIVPKRETGIYTYESAEAEVEMDRIGGTEKYHVHIRAKKMEDVLELFRRIKIGSILPDKSYENKQKTEKFRRIKWLWRL